MTRRPIYWIPLAALALLASPLRLSAQPAETVSDYRRWAAELDGATAAGRNRAMRMLLRSEDRETLPWLLDAVRQSSPEGAARAVGVLQEFALSASQDLSDGAFAALREAAQLRHSGAAARRALDEFSARLLARLKPQIEAAGGTLSSDAQGAVEVVIGSAWKGRPRDLAMLAKLSHVKRMSLERSPLTDADMQHLRGVRASTLYLGETSISRRGLLSLGPMETVGYLSLKRNRLQGLTTELMSRFPNVTHLGLDETDVTDEDLRALSATPSIETLWLNETEVSDAGLANLRHLSGLRTLYLTNTQVTGEGLARMSDVPLTYLSLKDAPISDEGLRAVSRLTSLTTLGLDHTSVTDEQMRHVAQLPNLRVLWLSKSNVTDRGLRQLTGMKQLRRVYVHGAAVTEAGGRMLAEAVPGCRVEGVMPAKQQAEK